MSNLAQGVVEATLKSGAKVKMVFDMNTWADAEEETGLTVHQLVEGLQNKTLSAKHQRALFWCAVKEHQPDLTLREAGAMFIELAEALEKAMKASMPEPEEAGADATQDPPKAEHGIGASS